MSLEEILLRTMSIKFAEIQYKILILFKVAKEDNNQICK